MSLILVTPVSSHRCSMASCLNKGIEMRQDFMVSVRHDGKPLAGVVVQVTSNIAGESREQFSGTTSTDGSVHVTTLPPGEYWLNAELLGISATTQCFHVDRRRSRRAKHKLRYEWGDLAPATRRVAGKLIDSQPNRGGTPIWNLEHPVETPIGGARLKLQNPITGNTFATTSDHNGSFAFEAIPSGTYVLHIGSEGASKARNADSTDLLFAVSPNANRGTLLLSRRNAGGGSCGGTYLELRNGGN
jgi:hypothetical protein